MEEWFGGPIMEKLISTGFDYMKNQARWQTGMKQELERLRENHPKIQAVIFASSQVQITDQKSALNKWLWQLRDAIDEADDVLDEFEYMKHENQLNENKEQTKLRSTMSSLKKGFVKIGKRAFQIDPLLKKLEEVVKKLDRVSADVGNFLYLLQSTKQEQQEQLIELYKTRETGSLPKNDLFGRVKEKESVIQWLRRPSNENETLSTSTTLYGSNISLLSIVGLGGMGKTTLLQHVYEDEITSEFNLKMWVCVSNNFDVKRVIGDMLESLKTKKPDVESLEALQRSLKSEVIGKKFLLVLDDIWEDESEERDKRKWENVLAPLTYGSLGSKILATTRIDSVALKIAKVINKKKITFRLEGLEEDDCLRLLSFHAFADVENPDIHHPKLRSIAVKIVKKVYGSPLAAKVMGGVLNSNLDERHWMKVLNSDFGNGEMDDIFPILRLSYMFLPEPLQNCFAYCGIFEEDHSFHKDDLVRMWIALGFIHTSNVRGGETMEDIGRRYFEVLVQKSFFQTENGISYTMHDLLHELAQSISAQECFRVMGDKKLLSTIPESIRHLSVETKNLDVLRKVTEFRKLRSLHLTCLVDDQDFICVLAEIFKASRSIRLLYINARGLKVIPEAIKYLIHLRYLMLRYTDVFRLPRSLSSLYQLQFIIYDFYISIRLPHDFLPMDMNNLSNLHYLELPWYDFPGMYGIGKLNSLEELDGFYVKNEKGYRIGEPEYMNKLHQLRIQHVENVKEPEEACSAKLCDKKNLTDLSLDWGDAHCFDLERKIFYPNLDEKVLDNLQPHNTLKKLSISAYMGARSAIWMNKAHLISNLERIQLYKCLEWETLPPFGQLPFLKSLYLGSMPKIKRLDTKFYGNDEDCVFPSLDVLHIVNCKAMEAWFDAAATKYDGLFPCLTELFLEHCPNLQELPSLPPKLKKLKIRNIGWKALNWQRGTGNSCSTSKSFPLETLEVLRCPNIRSIPLAEETARLAALRELTLVDCRNLIYLRGLQAVEANENHQLVLNKLVISSPSWLQMEPLRSLTSLEELEIKDNDELVSFPVEADQWFLQVSSSLRKLTFERLKSLQSLPTTLSSLSSLKTLYVREVPQLKLLPTIPISLEVLDLSSLESLQCLQPLSYSFLKRLYLGMIPLRNLPELPSSLYELSLCDLEKLDCLPSCLSNLPSLRILYISKVPLLQELQHLPPSLEELSVYYCQPEFEKRYERLAGSDWHKISHISDIDISTHITQLRAIVHPTDVDGQMMATPYVVLRCDPFKKR